MESRVEKALEAIYICCFGRDPVEEQDQSLLNVMLRAVFPSVAQSEIQRIVKDKAHKVAQGGDDGRFPEPKPLSKEAVKMQMKDLEFLQQNRDNWIQDWETEAISLQGLTKTGLQNLYYSCLTRTKSPLFYGFALFCFWKFEPNWLKLDISKYVEKKLTYQ